MYRMDIQMVDQEPYRSVQLIRRLDSRIPSPLLSGAASTSAVPAASLGRLAPLRAPVAQRAVSPATFNRPSNTPTPAASSSSSAGRGWTAVVAGPSSSRPSPAPSPTAWLTESKRSTDAGSSGATSTKILLPTAGASAPATTVAAEEVPDNWEDEP